MTFQSLGHFQLLDIQIHIDQVVNMMNLEIRLHKLIRKDKKVHKKVQGLLMVWIKFLR